jgi:uncharacterized protein YkwD
MERAISTMKAAVAELAALAVVALGVLAAPVAAAADGSPQSVAAAFEWSIDVERAAQGLGPLAVDPSVSAGAQEWSGGMALFDTLVEDVHFGAELSASVPTWRGEGENVGWGYSPQQIEAALMASPSHRANILGDYTHVGVGVFVDGAGRYWVTERFYR